MEFVIVSIGVLGFFFAVTALICWINTLTPAFESSLVLGLICMVLPPVAFLWGWANASKTNLKTNMLVWTVAFIPCMVFLMYTPTLRDYLGGLV